MRISIYQSFNLDTIVEHVTDITYNNPSSTQSPNSSFSIIQYNAEPALILKFFNDDGSVIDFSPTDNYATFKISCCLGFKSLLLNQINTTIKRVISSYDPRFDNECNISIDNEKMLVTDVRSNKVLGRSYLSVTRSNLPMQHYRDSTIRVIRSNPEAIFYDASNGIVKITWNTRDVSVIGAYELEITFDRYVNNQRSKWTLSPINVYVLQDYSLSA